MTSDQKAFDSSRREKKMESPNSNTFGIIQKKTIKKAATGENHADKFGLASDAVEYSLNKKGRWNFVEEFRSHILQLQNPDTGLKVSALEKADTHGYIGTRGSAFAFHDVEHGKEVHRYPNSTLGQEKTLTEKPMPPKRRRRHRNRGDQAPQPNNQPEEVGDETYIRYLITTPHPSEKFRQSKVKKALRSNIKPRNVRRARGSVSDDDDFYYSVSEDDDFKGYESDSDYVETPSSNYTLDISDCVVTKAPKGNKRKSDNDNESSSISSSFDVLSDWEEWKPWVRQISYEENPSKYRPIKYRPEKRSENKDNNLFPDPLLLNISQIVDPIYCSIDNDELEPENLLRAFGHNYFECSCIPRRFCIDISETFPYAQREVNILCCVQVETHNLSDLQLFSLDDADSGDDSNIKIWVNGLFSDENLKAAPVSISEKSKLRKIINLTVDSLSQLGEEIFPPMIVKERTNKASSSNVQAGVSHVIPSYMKPTVSYLTDQDVTGAALQESALSPPKLQSQFSSVRTYQWYMDTENATCGICYTHPLTTDEAMCLANCQHWFCQDCWIQYCIGQIRNGLIPISCPDSNCKEILDLDTLTTILPLLECRRYSSLISNQHLLKNRDSWIWCPNPFCGRVLRTNLSDDVVSILECVCGQIWCCRCDQPIHWPLECDHSKRYYERLDAYGDAKFINEYKDKEKVVMAKRCPQCNTPMEKGFGCNHIVCRCGLEFCWQCLSRWDSGRHYNCGNTRKNFEEFVLLDVNVKVDNIMSKKAYHKSVKHRKACFPNVLHSIRSDLKMLKNHDHKLMSKFLKIYITGHHFLEYATVWLYFESQKLPQEQINCMKSFMDRLNFTISYSHEIAKSAKIKTKIDQLENLIKKAETMLKKAVSFILNIEK